MGSDASSSAMNSKVIFFPLITSPCLLISSTASRAPFSLSFPRCAFGPVNGATLPIFTVTESALTSALSFCPQAVNKRTVVLNTAMIVRPESDFTPALYLISILLKLFNSLDLYFIIVSF